MSSKKPAKERQKQRKPPVITPSGETIEKTLNAQTVAVSGFYRPKWSSGAAVPPIFHATTFVSPTAKDAEGAFANLIGSGSENVYGRHNTPNGEIFEHRLAGAWDKAEACASFASGMAAIDAVLREFVRRGDIVLHGEPVYGCTDDLFRSGLVKDIDIIPVGFSHTDLDNPKEIIKRVMSARIQGRVNRVAAIFVETPSNPLLTMFDIAVCADMARRIEASFGYRPLVIVDNTFNGPVGQQPLKHGADLVVYSCTKYIGGHSNAMGGAVLGSTEHINRIKARRMLTGGVLSPESASRFLDGLSTVQLRMIKQSENAQRIAEQLARFGKKIKAVYYPGLLTEGSQYDVYRRQCSISGGMLSFKVRGGKRGAFRFLDTLWLIKLAVSLGGVESLIEHPASTSHARISKEVRAKVGITDDLVRLSVGIEECDDLMRDIEGALDAV